MPRRRRLVQSIVRGLYQAMILGILARDGPLHGYAIRRRIAELSGGLLDPSESTVYDALKSLEAAGLIEGSWMIGRMGGPPRKYYRVTEEGRREAGELCKMLRRVFEAVLSLACGVEARLGDC